MTIKNPRTILHRHKKTITKHTQTTWEWIRRHTAILGLIGMSIIAIIIGALLIWVATLKVPSITSFADRKVTSSTKIYDRTGTVVLYDVHENIKRTVITGTAMSQHVRDAIIAVEDKEFYNHIGVQPKAIVRAGLSNIFPFIGKQSGGSTITQQLVKNTLLTQQRSLSRKIKEWVLAIKLERIMSKDDILTTYLNEAPYGGTIYGVEEASQSFFGVSAKNVDITQSAYLAAIPNAPSYYSPYGKNKNALENRKNLVLKNMFEQEFITESEYDTAKKEIVIFRPQQESSGKALHFIEYIRQYLESKYGVEAVTNNGMKVITTLDWDLQQVGEKTIRENVAKNEKDYNATNSALVAIDPKTGQILTMVGSRDYFDRKIDGAYNIATAGRQPGSSFKPLVYARAFEKGFLPETVVFDIPTQFGPCGAFDRSSISPCYAPDNYDNKFIGPISLKNALAQSRNIPAVQLLAMVGLSDALQTAKNLGITTLDRDASRYGLTLVLGGGEISLLDLTSVYGVFANDGVRNPPVGILEVDDSSGNILEKYSPKTQSVISADAVRKLSSILTDNIARTPLFGANSFFYFNQRPVAGKTGTTNSNKDAWVFGYTPSISVGVWSGNNDNKPMKKGSSISGPAWRTFMDAAVAKLPYDRPGAIETFPIPDADPNYEKLAPVIRGAWAGGESFFIDTISGKLATDLTPVETKKEFVIPNPHNILYWLDSSNPARSSQFSRWEAEFQSWISNHPGIIPAMPVRPLEHDNVHIEANQPQVTIINPLVNTTINKDTTLSIQLSINSIYPIKKVDYYLGGQFIGSGSGTTFNFIPSDTIITPGNILLKAIVTDNVYNKGEVEQSIIIQ